MTEPACPHQHTAHRDPDFDGERVWLTCGDEVLAEQTWPPSVVDLSHEIRYFLKAAMAEHERNVLIAERDALRAETERLRGTVEWLQTFWAIAEDRSP